MVGLSAYVYLREINRIFGNQGLKNIKHHVPTTELLNISKEQQLNCRRQLKIVQPAAILKSG